MTSVPAATRRAAIARGTLIALIALLGLWVVHGFLPALVWAVVVAVAIDPLVQRAERHSGGRHRGWIAASFTLAFALIVLIPIAAGIAQAAREAHDLTHWVMTARAQGVPPPAWIATLPFGQAELTGWWRANLADPAMADHHFRTLSHALLGAQAKLIGVGLLHRAVTFGFTLLTLFFLVRDRDAIVAQVRGASARMLGIEAERIGRQALRSVRGTIDGLVLVGIGEGVVMTLVYAVLDVPHPVLLGVATGIAAMIPFVAPLLFAVAALLLLTQGATGAAVAVIVIGLAVIFVADHFIRPVLIGNATRLPFLWVLIGILGGVETLGLLGLFVGPATMAVLVMLWRELVEAEDAMPVA